MQVRQGNLEGLIIEAASYLNTGFQSAVQANTNAVNNSGYESRTDNGPRSITPFLFAMQKAVAADPEKQFFASL